MQISNIFTDWLSSFQVTSGYGQDSVVAGRVGHSGIDYAVPLGTPLIAAAAGKVVTSMYGPTFGNQVVIDIGEGLQVLYGHASELLVKVGDMVQPGQVIAKSGDTGNSTGPHLHIGIKKDGAWIDPGTFLAAKAENSEVTSGGNILSIPDSVLAGDKRFLGLFVLGVAVLIIIKALGGDIEKVREVAENA